MSTYRRPEKNLHRGFAYLDDGIVVNSLSSFEAGKVDEVVSKGVVTREGGGALSAGIGLGPLAGKGEVAKRGNTSLEEEMVKTRTRFSIFQLWHEQLVHQKALGKFEGWGPNVLADVRAGDTVELRASLELLPLQGLFRIFEWFAGKASQTGNPFSQKGEELKTTKDTLRTMQLLMGDEKRSFFVLAYPEGDPGPAVAMELRDEWLIGDIAKLSGAMTVIAQVERVLNEGESYPTARVLSGGPYTEIERQAVLETVAGFAPVSEVFGGTAVTQSDAEISGPALILTPIAIFR